MHLTHPDTATPDLILPSLALAHRKPKLQTMAMFEAFKNGGEGPKSTRNTSRGASIPNFTIFFRLNL